MVHQMNCGGFQVFPGGAYIQQIPIVVTMFNNRDQGTFGNGGLQMFPRRGHSSVNMPIL